MTILSMLLFGFVLGCFAKHEQLWSAPAKITAGLIFSGMICFPSLYIFATLAGARVTISQLAACLAGALALAGLLLLGFAPAVWIFAESTDSLGFMGSLAIGAWIIAVTFAFKFRTPDLGRVWGALMMIPI
jgi:fatty acid desaturase